MTVLRKENQAPTGRLLRAPEASGSKRPSRGRVDGEFLLERKLSRVLFHPATVGERKRVTNAGNYGSNLKKSVAARTGGVTASTFGSREHRQPSSSSRGTL